jgi:hypothetical protein
VLSQKISDAASSLWIIHGRDDAARLIKQHYPFSSSVHWPAIYLDSVCIGINLATKLGHNLTVNPHPTLGNELLHLSTRTNPTLSQKLLKSNFRHTPIPTSYIQMRRSLYCETCDPSG